MTHNHHPSPSPTKWEKQRPYHRARGPTLEVVTVLSVLPKYSRSVDKDTKQRSLFRQMRFLDIGTRIRGFRRLLTGSFGQTWGRLAVCFFFKKRDLLGVWPALNRLRCKQLQAVTYGSLGRSTLTVEQLVEPNPPVTFH